MNGGAAGPRRAALLAQAALIGGGAALVAWLGSHADVYPLDGYYYLAKARSLASGLGPVVPWNDGIDGRLSLGYSFALALPVRLAGEAGFWWLAAALHALTGALLALILRRIEVRPQVAVGAVALTTFNPVALWWATVPAPEPLLTALVAASVLFALRWRQGASDWNLLLAALFGGLAFFTRAGGLIFVAAPLALAWSRLREGRRRGLAAACVALLLAPEVLQLGWLYSRGAAWTAVVAFFSEVRAHLGEIDLGGALWLHVRAPYRIVFRFDTEPWLYARFFPTWLTGAQGLVLALYLGAMVAALVSGFYKRGVAFVCAVGILAAALLHSFWYEASERFDCVALPAAAVVFAWAIDKLFFWARPQRRVVFGLAVTGICAAIAGGYGVRVSQMNAARLTLQQGGRDFRAVARAVNGLGLGTRPVVTDLGPYLAFYLDGHSYLDGDGRGLAEDVVPEGAAGRAFLAKQQVGAVVSRRRAEELQRGWSLAPGETRRVDAPGTTLLVLELQPGAGATGR